MTATTPATELVEGRPRPIFIEVNNRPVEIDRPRVSGLEIKEAAISQGAPIQLDFQLAMRDLDGKQHIIGDGDPVDLTWTFFATAGDDNS